jgi:uncharacterized protein involved in exopolysaccharide biosynthesis
MTYLSYLGAHWILFIIVVLAVVGLGLLAWFTKNLKYVLAAVVLVIAGLAYQSSNMDGYKRKVSEDAQAQVNILTERIAAMSHVTSLDNQHAVSDAYLNTQLKDLSRATPKNDGPCLDAASAHRVWTVRGPAVPVTAPISSRRISNVLPWSLHRPAASPNAG